MYTLTRAELELLGGALGAGEEQARQVWAQVMQRGEQRVLGMAEGLRLLEMILRVTQTPLCVTDERGCFVLVNDAYCALYGYGREELVGAEVTLIVPPELHAGAMAFYVRMLEGESQTVSQEWGAVRRDGQRMTVSSTRMRLETAEGMLLLHTAQDTGEQRRQAQEHVQLEARAAHNLRLESLGLLAGGVAHDFNNILSGILAIAGQLREERGEDAVVEGLVRELEHSALRASEVIQTLRDYARQQPATQREEDLEQLAQDTMRLLRTYPGAERLVWRRSSRSVRTLISGSQIQQVILNLLVNALEASARAGGAVIVRVERREIVGQAPLNVLSGAPVEAGWWAALEVKDHGVGLTPGTEGRVFDPFYTTKGPGRGLGLASSGSIIRAHSGAVVVESVAGEGATFTLLLPCWGPDDQA